MNDVTLPISYRICDSLAMQDLQRRLRNRPIYIWNSEKHKAASNPNNEIKGWCCFNHIIGLPTKNGIPQPLWDYQDMIYQDTFTVAMGWSLSILTRTRYITLTNIKPITRDSPLWNVNSS